MLAALLIVFREVLEAGLIVGIVLAATQGIAGRGAWIAGGVAAGALGATIVAVFAGALSDALAGVGQEVFNATILIAAVLMLSWHNLWIATHARELTRDMKSLGAAVQNGERTLLAMAVVVAVAIMREGSEVVLFLFGIAAGGEKPLAMAAGSVGGLAAGVAVSFVIFRGLLAIPTGKLFSVTNVLIALLAAGMAGQAAVFLVRANWIPSLGDQLWDTSAILPDDGMIGRALHALVGYSDRPMGVQLACYLAVLLSLTLFGRRIAQSQRPKVEPA
jgi:high-affinity iron transporter